KESETPRVAEHVLRTYPDHLQRTGHKPTDRRCAGSRRNQSSLPDPGDDAADRHARHGHHWPGADRNGQDVGLRCAASAAHCLAWRSRIFRSGCTWKAAGARGRTDQRPLLAGLAGPETGSRQERRTPRHDLWGARLRTAERTNLPWGWDWGWKPP